MLQFLLATLVTTYSITYGAPAAPIRHTISGLTLSECVVIEAHLRKSVEEGVEVEFDECRPSDEVQAAGS